jgi:hypothetical protein
LPLLHSPQTTAQNPVHYSPRLKRRRGCRKELKNVGAEHKFADRVFLLGRGLDQYLINVNLAVNESFLNSEFKAL